MWKQNCIIFHPNDLCGCSFTFVTEFKFRLFKFWNIKLSLNFIFPTVSYFQKTFEVVKALACIYYRNRDKSMLEETSYALYRHVTVTPHTKCELANLFVSVTKLYSTNAGNTLCFHLFPLFPVCDNHTMGVILMEATTSFRTLCHRDMRYYSLATAAKNRGTSPMQTGSNWSARLLSNAYQS